MNARIDSLAFDTSSIEIHRVLGFEQISRPFRFEIEIATPEEAPLVVRDLLGAEASLVFEAGGVDQRKIHGMIADVTDLLTADHAYRGYRLTLVPRVCRLALIQMQDVFLDLSVPDVVSRKLELVGVGKTDFEFRYLDRYSPRELFIQYKETDLAFVSRLTEHLGIGFFFLHDDGVDRIVFTDHPGGYGRVPLPEGARGIPFHHLGDEAGTRERVFALESIARAMPETFMVNDFNYRINAEVPGSYASPDGLGGGVVEFGENTLSVEESQRLARVRGEERAALHSFYRGESAVLGFSAGLRFVLEGHPRLQGDPELLLVAVEHEFLRPKGEGASGATSYTNRFRAVEVLSTYRPERVTPKPRIFGVLSAIVEPPLDGTVAKHPKLDDDGRYLVRFTFDPTPLDQRSKWSLPVRMIQAHAGPQYGVHFPLRPGVEVMIVFEDGDPDRPLIAGAVPNVATPSPVQRRHQNESRIQTSSGIRLTIRDY